MISQLAMTPSLDDVAAQISSMQTRLVQSLVVLRPSPAVDATGPPSARDALLALKIGPDVAVVLVRPDLQAAWPADITVMASDGASGLTLVRAAGAGEGPAQWAPRRLQESHYLLATDTISDRPTLRPVFVGSLDPVLVPEWPGEIWRVPAQTALESGEFVFSTMGDLVGVTAQYADDTAIVPASQVLELAERLLASGTSGPAGEVGLDVQPLTPGLRSATAALSGVVVSWVDGQGPAADQVRVTDVIETLNGEAVPTPRHWRARVARVVAGERLTIRIRRDGKVVEQEVVAAPRTEAKPGQSLGLTLRTSPGRGAIVVSVERASRADDAGLLPNDLITHIGRTRTPTPAQIRAAFMATQEGASIPVAVTRGDGHNVVSLMR